MKKTIKKIIMLTACVFTLILIGKLSLNSDFENNSSEAANVVVPEEVRRGHEEEGVFLG